MTLPFRFTLRFKLAIVSLILACLPLTGFWYAWNMKDFLLSAQEEALVLSAKAVATSLNDRPELFERSALQDFAGATEIQAYELERAIALDGSIRDWEAILNQSKSYGTAGVIETSRGYRNDSLFYRHVSGTLGRYLYLLFMVNDQTIVHRADNSLHLTQSDHLRIMLQNAEGRLESYILSPAASGWVTAYLMPEDEQNFVPVRNETKIHGIWKDSADGYVVEVRMPLEMVHGRLSLAIADVDDYEVRDIDEVISIGGIRQVENLGVLLAASPELEKILQALDRPGARIWVVDRRLRVRALAGNLQEKSFPAGNEPFFSRLFRLLFSHPPTNVDQAAPGATRPSKQHLAASSLNDLQTVMTGKSFTVRRVLADKGIEVITAAEPLWIGNDVLGAVVVDQTTQTVLSGINKIMERTILLTVIVFVIGGIVLLLFASRISNRILRLRREAQHAIARDGRINAVIPAERAGDELGELSRTLSDLSSRLLDYHRYQEKMADNLEHELRTPIAGISASLSNLSHTLHDVPAKAAANMADARENLKRIENILGKIRDAAILKEALRQDEQERFNLVAALKAWVDNGYIPAFKQRRFNLQVAGEALMIRADPLRIHQVIDKLVENAVDFSPVGSTIRLDLETAEKDLRGDQLVAEIKICNEGPLLPPDKVDQVFHSMVSFRKRNPESAHMGLGLYIVRTIVEFHGGTVSAANREDGIAGVCFTIRLPIAS